MKPDPIISSINLRKRYKGSSEEALKGINLNIQPSEFFGLLGPNSAGKTTLLSIICGLISASSGDIKIFGESIRNNHPIPKELIGLVPQEIALYPTLTVFENIIFFGQMYGLTGKPLRIKADEFMEKFNLSEHRNKLISRCSGGIKRRVNLICGILHNPSLLLLDEPTLGVDSQLRTMIFEYLEELNKKGTTIIFTTHYMREAELLCSRVSFIDHGEIILEGNPAELVAAQKACQDLGQLFLNLTGRELRD